MKKLDFDAFSLITPLEKKIPLQTDVPDIPPDTEHFKLATAMRKSKYFIPQVELLGVMATQSPSPARVLRFARYEVPDYALQKVIKEMDKRDRDAIQRYLWDEGTFEYDKQNRRWIDFDPVFTDEIEKAFQRLLSLLKQLALLKTVSRTVKNGTPL